MGVPACGGATSAAGGAGGGGFGELQAAHTAARAAGINGLRIMVRRHAVGFPRQV
jgi:hypothetical protein